MRSKCSMPLPEEIKNDYPRALELQDEPVLLTYEQWEQIHRSRERLRGEAEIKSGFASGRLTVEEIACSNGYRVIYQIDRRYFTRAKFVDQVEMARIAADDIALRILHEMAKLKR